MHEEHSLTWLSFIPGLEGVPAHVLMAILIAALLVIFTAVASMQLARVAKKPGREAIMPEKKLTIRNFFEIAAESLFELCENTMGYHDAQKFFPVIGTLFIFIFSCNLVGLVPGFTPPTDNINTTMALGLFVFLYYNFVGLKETGLAYLKHFLGPVLWLGPLMLVIEIASHIFRPLSLALRLKWNMTGDHVVLGVFSGLVPYLLPVIFYGLGVFVSFVQAFVFCLMTMVYISLAAAHEEH